MYSFPDLMRLGAVEEQKLRELGFGYRAPFITKTTRTILDNGGADWLMQLRSQPLADVRTSLEALHGVGRKVADCVILFSMDQPAVVPVDTHVWNIAVRDFDPTLKEAKSLTPKIHERVSTLFTDRYGGYAGWAHSLLFAAELPQFSKLLPEDVQVI